MQAVLGVHPGTGQTVVQIKEPPVIYSDTNGDHDIMLLKLSKATDAITPIQLPDCSAHLKINAVQIAGYGPTTADSTGKRLPGEAHNLQCADINVVDCKKLRDLNRLTNPKRLDQHWFCGQSSKVDACHGDSGGGVVYNDIIYGVIAFTGDPEHVCNEAVGFMDVCAYKDWIEKTIAKTFIEKTAKIAKACLGCG